jgi:alkanesulfonate monooxygenase SsuD/methylene tetrahydromethanopterin reductase-like flavin-dependent oxidoreductase (luciferase family)
MREFVLALRAIWSSWQDGTTLRFEGDFYTHKLMTPMFVPEPQLHGFPKIFIAAVGEAMTEMCGEIADGMIGHAFTTKRYLDEVTIPTFQRGIKRSGRDRRDFQLMCPVFVVTGESTPAYRKVLELHGWGDLQDELRRLSLRGDWDAMGSLIDDEILNTFAAVAPIGELAAKLRDRCDGVIDRVLLGFPKSVSAASVAAVLQELRTP